MYVDSQFEPEPGTDRPRSKAKTSAPTQAKSIPVETNGASRSKAKGKGKETTVINVDDDSDDDPIVDDGDSDSDPMAIKDKAAKQRFRPTRKGTPAALLNMRAQQINHDANRDHTGEFDSPPHAPSSMESQWHSVKDRLKPKSSAQSRQGEGQPARKATTDGFATLPASSPPIKPIARRPPKVDEPVEIVELAIHPYAFTPDHVFPLEYLDQSHFIALPFGKKSNRVVTIGRHGDKGRQTLIELKREDLTNIITGRKDEYILQFIFAREQSLRRMDRDKFNKLLESVPLHLDEWRGKQNVGHPTSALCLTEPRCQFRDCREYE